MPKNKKALKGLFINGLPSPSVVVPIRTGSGISAPCMFPPGVVEATAIEVSPMIPFEIRTIVCEIVPIAVVAVPGGIVIVGVAREVCFTDGGVGIVSAFIDGSRCGVDRSRCYIHSGARDTETDMRIYIDLGVTFGSDEAGGYNSGKDQ